MLWNALRKPSEGVRRLSLLCGGLSAFAWFVFVSLASNFFSNSRDGDWALFAGTVVFSFCVPVVVVRAVAWVIAGFKG